MPHANIAMKESTLNLRIDPGKFILRVGDSSENTPLHADIAIH